MDDPRPWYLAMLSVYGHSQDMELDHLQDRVVALIVSDQDTAPEPDALLFFDRMEIGYGEQHEYRG